MQKQRDGGQSIGQQNMVAFASFLKLSKLTEAIASTKEEYSMKDSLSFLFVAGNVEIMKLLIENGADLNVTKSIDEWTPLHIAANDGANHIVYFYLFNIETFITSFFRLISLQMQVKEKLSNYSSKAVPT